MGSEIVYCRACQGRLVGRDFEQGKAIRADDGVYCAPCAPAELKAPAPLKPAPTARRIATRRAAGASAPSSRTPLIAGVAVALLAVVALVAIASSGSPAPRPPQPPPPAPPPAPIAKPAPTPLSPLPAAALGKARDHRRTSPADLEGQMRLFTEAVFAAEGTPLLAEAKKELEEVRRAREAVEQKAREAVEQRAREAKALEAAKRSPPLVVFKDGIGKGFFNGSWKSKVDFKAAAPAGSGTCISFAPEERWAGLYLVSEKGVDGTAYTTLAFSAQASREGQKFMISLYYDQDGKATAKSTPLAEVGGCPPAGRWQRYSVRLDRLGVADRTFRGFALQDASGGAQPALYVDDVSFVSD